MDNKEEAVRKRKRLRAENFNYNSNGAYFLTICSLNHEHVFGRIVGAVDLDGPENVRPQIILSECGEIVEKNIKTMAGIYKDISIDKYVIMPNHIHFLLNVFDPDYPLNNAPTGNRQRNRISNFETALKKYSTEEIGENVWQRGFHDHIIRNEEDYQKHWQYIEDNPIKWLMKEDEYC